MYLLNSDKNLINNDDNTFDMAFFTTAPYAAKWAWLKEYIDNRCDAENKTKPEDADTYASAFTRYNLAAFFGNTQRTEWPATPNYTSYGISSTEYYSTWGSKLCTDGPTTDMEQMSQIEEVVAIYDMLGRLQSTLKPYMLPRGIYIVLTSDGATHKIIR